MSEPKITMNVNVSASLRATNGTQISVDGRMVKIQSVGARGGLGPVVEIPLSDWDTIHVAVCRVRVAIDETAKVAAKTVS